MENTYKQRLTVSSGNKFIAKTFLYMFLELIITAVSAIGFGLLFDNIWHISDKSHSTSSPYFTAYIIILIVSLVAMIGVSIWFSVSAVKGNKNLVIPFTVYALLMGVFGSSFVMFIDPVSIGIAFGVSCLAFGIMAALGAIIKKDINFLAIVVMGLFLGAGMLALTNLIFWLCGLRYLVTSMYLLIEGIVFAAVMIITMIDVYNIKKIAERGDVYENVALFSAFSLYIDFINIFLRVLLVVVRIRGN